MSHTHGGPWERKSTCQGAAQVVVGMGVAAGDYNNDGFADLYVTQYGRSILYRNNGDGTFTDVTEKAGVGAVVDMR